jgi:hypothetical protein
MLPNSRAGSQAFFWLFTASIFLFPYPSGDVQCNSPGLSEIILPALLLVVFQVGQDGGPGPDGKVI